MKKESSILSLMAVALALGCSSKSSDQATFTATWTLLNENGITRASEKGTVAVTADKNLFRIVTRTDHSESLEIYDGDMLHSQTTYFSDEVSIEGAAASPNQSSVRSEALSAQQATHLRFWAESSEGKSIAGGQIAGRDTLLHEIRAKRPDGEILNQRWVDAETGVVLKSIDMIYASQVNSMLTRTLRECQKIDYGPADPAVFRRP